MGEKILRAKAAADRFGFSTRTLYREVAAGNIPPPIKITDRSTGWREGTIDRVIADRESGQRCSAGVVLKKRKPGRPRKLAVSGDHDETKDGDQGRACVGAGNGALVECP